MYPPVPIAVFLSLAMAAAPVRATGPAHPLEPAPPRSVVVSEAAQPPEIHTGLLQSTLIVLPAEERVVSVFAGDTVNWVFDGGRLASRFVSLKPKSAGAATDVHIVSDHGNEYTLELREVSRDQDPKFDTKVLLSPGDPAAKDRLTQIPVFVPAAELERAHAEAAAAKTAEEAVQKAEQTKAEAFRSAYPASLHFDFVWDQRKARELGLMQIWRDEKFTYLRGSFPETPALYELKDGKGSLINFDFNSGLYTVPKQLQSGYLAIGKQKLEFHRAGGVN